MRSRAGRGEGCASGLKRIRFPAWLQADGEHRAEPGAQRRSPMQQDPAGRLGRLVAGSLEERCSVDRRSRRCPLRARPSPRDGAVSRLHCRTAREAGLRVVLGIRTLARMSSKSRSVMWRLINARRSPDLVDGQEAEMADDRGQTRSERYDQRPEYHAYRLVRSRTRSVRCDQSRDRDDHIRPAIRRRRPAIPAAGQRDDQREGAGAAGIPLDFAISHQTAAPAAAAAGSGDGSPLPRIPRRASSRRNGSQPSRAADRADNRTKAVARMMMRSRRQVPARPR